MNCVPGWDVQYYRMYLMRKPEETLTGMEAYLRGLMQKQSIAYFPIRRALSLPTESNEDEAILEVAAQVGELKASIGEWQASLGTSLQGQFDALQQRLGKLTADLEAVNARTAAASSSSASASATGSATPTTQA